MDGVYRWLDDGEDDGKITRELKLKNRTSEQLHKASLVRSANHIDISSQYQVCIHLNTAEQ